MLKMDGLIEKNGLQEEFFWIMNNEITLYLRLPMTLNWILKVKLK